jgi:hypothetical protein
MAIICKICGEPLDNGVQLVRCTCCQTPMHNDCAKYIESCPVYGCNCQKFKAAKIQVVDADEEQDMVFGEVKESRKDTSEIRPLIWDCPPSLSRTSLSPAETYKLPEFVGLKRPINAYDTTYLYRHNTDSSFSRSFKAASELVKAQNEIKNKAAVPEQRPEPQPPITLPVYTAPPAAIINVTPPTPGHVSATPSAPASVSVPAVSSQSSRAVVKPKPHIFSFLGFLAIIYFISLIFIPSWLSFAIVTGLLLVWLADNSPQEPLK